MNPTPRKNKGFTLVKILFCVSLIAIITGIALPRLFPKEQEPAFPAEKVLTCSATEWCQSTGRRLDEFQLIGVHSNIFNNVPPNTVVIVSYQYSEWNTVGTALVPKAPEKPEK